MQAQRERENGRERSRKRLPNESEICLHLSGNCCQVAKRLTGRRSRSTEAVSSHLSPRLILSLLISSLPCQVRQSTGGVASGGGSCRKTQPHSFAKLMAFHLGASFMQGCRHHRHRHPAHACPLLVSSSSSPRRRRQVCVCPPKFTCLVVARGELQICMQVGVVAIPHCHCHCQLAPSHDIPHQQQHHLPAAAPAPATI